MQTKEIPPRLVEPKVPIEDIVTTPSDFTTDQQIRYSSLPRMGGESDCGWAETLTDADFAAFSALLGKNIQTKQDLLDRVRSMVSVDVGGVAIPLEPALLDRLKSRCFHQPFDEFLRGVIRKQLFDYTGS